MVTVTHAKNVSIADDPTAAAKGEVLPSDWNANHVVSGVRTVLSADTNFFVSATGNDSHGGTNSSSDAWLTIQHAIDFLAANVDGGGFNVTINVGAGTFVGFFMRPMTGISNLGVIGAGSTQTILTHTTASEFGFGECVSVYVNTGTVLCLNQLQFLQSLTNVDHIAVAAAGENVELLDPTGVANTDISFQCPVGGTVNQFCVSMFAPAFLATSGPGTITCGGAGQESNGVFNLTQGSTITASNITFAFSGIPKYDIGFVRILGNSRFTTLATIAFSGTFTGPQYDIEEASSLVLGGIAIPGSLAPVVMGSANTLEDNCLSPIITGLPTTADLPGGQQWGLFQDSRDTALGPVTAINSGGNVEFIGRITLKANLDLFVSSTGNDSNDGLTSGTAWLTIQHAMKFIAGTLDIAGFLITVHIGAGTFAGFGVVSTVGAGVIQFKGAGSGSTTISNGPNDGVINFGECFDANEACQSVIAIDAVKFAPASAAPVCVIYVPLVSLFLGDFVAVSSDIAWDFTNCIAVGISVQATGSQIQYLPGTANMTLGGASISSLFDITSFGFFGANTVAFSLSGNLTVSDAFVSISVGSVAQFFSCSVSGGTITGNRFDVNAGGVLFDVTPGSLGQTFFPGSSPGVCDNTSSYDLWQGPLLDTQTASYTLKEVDIGGRVEMNNAGANIVTIDTDTNFTCPISGEIRITQIGAGATTIAGAVGVTVHNAGAVGGQWKSAVVYKRGANEWVQT